MSVVVRVLFYVALTGSVTSSIYCLMVAAAAARFGLRKRRDERAVADFLPPLSVLKPIHGVEPGMEQNFESFFTQEYPAPYELLFCARHDSDPGLQLARAVGSRYPQVAAQYVTCGEPMPNATKQTNSNNRQRQAWSAAPMIERAIHAREREARRHGAGVALVRFAVTRISFLRTKYFSQCSLSENGEGGSSFG